MEGAGQGGESLPGGKLGVQLCFGTEVQVGVGGADRQGCVQRAVHPNGGGAGDGEVSAGVRGAGRYGNQTGNRLLRFRCGGVGSRRDGAVGSSIPIGIAIRVLRIVCGGALRVFGGGSGRAALGGILRVFSGGSGRAALGGILRVFGGGSGRAALGGILRVFGGGSGRAALGGILRVFGGGSGRAALGGILRVFGGSFGRTTLGGTLRVLGRGTLGRGLFCGFLTGLHSSRLRFNLRCRHRQQIGQQHGQCQEQGKKSCSDF